MKIIGLILVSFIIQSIAEHPAETFIVNLDLPPAQRWPWIEMQAFNTSIWKATALINKFVPSYLVPILEDAMEELALNGYFGDYAYEIKSGADIVGIPFGAAILLNLIYEVEAGCTSIVTTMQNGTIFHGRNLDFNLHKELQDLAINVEFQSNGQTIYRGTTFVGYVGLLTGCREGSFCITVDERDVGGVWENLLEALFEDASVTAFLIRDTLNSNVSFNDAINIMNGTKLIAPVYYIMSGVNEGEGAIITRDRNDGNVRRLGDSKTGDGSFYLCETNYDWWKEDGDGRRTAAEKMIENYGLNNMDVENIFNVLSTAPILNKGTTYTVLMSAETGYFNTTVRGKH